MRAAQLAPIAHTLLFVLSVLAGRMVALPSVQARPTFEWDMSHVPYKGSPPALQDVMGGHVPLMFDGPATSIPMIKGGRIRP